MSPIVLEDVRRLTGPNILSRAPLVVVDVVCAASDVDPFCALYVDELDRMRGAVGLAPVEPPVVRRSRSGATIGYAAPLDLMLACAEMSEWAATRAAAIRSGERGADPRPARETFASMIALARNPNLTALVAEAARRDVPFLWDDAEVTVGAGHTSRSYPISRVPDASSIPWTEVARIPIALVTGTNGKTTSTRLLAHALQRTEHGGVIGVASSDGVVVGGDVVERGDWSGPAAARRVLRHPSTEVAVLETARGGILRRGLAIADCDVALLTNVSTDHFGGYGVDDLAGMADVKAVVAHAARADGAVVLNAGDPALVRLARSGTLRASVVLFADLEAGVAETAAIVKQHREAGGAVVFTRDGSIVAVGKNDGDERVLVRVDDVPLTFHGAARYNVENALGVVAAAASLGADDAAVAAALRSFQSTDNPRRGQLVERRGVRVFLDFGHNREAVRSAMGVVDALRQRSPGAGGGSRLSVVTASPGDRSDDDMMAVARAIFATTPDQVYVRDLPHHLRGRSAGEVPRVFAQAFREIGLAESAFHVVESEVSALQRAFADARPGDVIAVLVHLDHDDVRAFLDSLLTPAP